MGVVLKGLIETEAGIQKAILQWGAYTEGISMFRMNVMGIPIHGKPGKFRPAAEKGIADIYVQVMVEGIAVSGWLEVKRKRGKQQASQIEFAQRVENYFVVTSPEEAAIAIAKIKIETKLKIKELHELA